MKRAELDAAIAALTLRAIFTRGVHDGGLSVAGRLTDALAAEQGRMSLDQIAMLCRATLRSAHVFSYDGEMLGIVDSDGRFAPIVCDDDAVAPTPRDPSVPPPPMPEAGDRECDPGPPPTHPRGMLGTVTERPTGSEAPPDSDDNGV